MGSCGIALLVMLWRRRMQRIASDALAAELAARISQSQQEPVEEADDIRPHRLIDDYAIPIALAARAVAKGTRRASSAGSSTRTTAAGPCSCVAAIANVPSA